MATIRNDRDVLLQGTSPRYANSSACTLLIAADTPVFHVSTGGAGTPTVVNLTANLISIPGTVNWSVAGASSVTPSGNTCTLAFANMTAASATVTATITYNSVVYSDSKVITKVVDGAGSRTAVMDMYQWAVSAPVTFPSGSSVYTWAAGTWTAPGTPIGWTTTPGAPVAGQTLWLARTVYFDTTSTTTTSIPWTANTALSIAAAGTSGSNGTRTAVLELYQWAAAAPVSFPVGASTYTWATGAFTSAATLNGWTALPGSAVAGQTLWGCKTVYSDKGTSTTSAVTWSASTAYPLGGAGTNGTNGTNGLNGTNGTNGTNGSNGADGTKAVVVNCFMWATLAPGSWAQALTYNWTTGSCSAFPSGWSASATVAPGNGYTLYMLSLTIAATATATSTAANWSAATSGTIGFRNDGSIGLTGASGQSARRGYVVNSSGSVPGAVTPGAGDVPPTSGAGTWSFVATSTLIAGQYMYQVDGLYTAGGNIAWGNPYLSNLKVGSLSALSADLGVVQISSTGNLSANGKTYGAGSGYFLGYSGGQYVLDVGSTTSYMRWTGSAMQIAGDIEVGTQINLKGGPSGVGSRLSFKNGAGVENAYILSTHNSFGSTAPCITGFTVYSNPTAESNLAERYVLGEGLSATSSNTYNSVVARDGSGNFSAGTLTAEALVQTMPTPAGGAFPSAGYVRGGISLWQGGETKFGKWRQYFNAEEHGMTLSYNFAIDPFHTYPWTTSGRDSGAAGGNSCFMQRIDVAEGTSGQNFWSAEWAPPGSAGTTPDFNAAGKLFFYDGGLLQIQNGVANPATWGTPDAAIQLTSRVGAATSPSMVMRAAADGSGYQQFKIQDVTPWRVSYGIPTGRVIPPVSGSGVNDLLVIDRNGYFNPNVSGYAGYFAGPVRCMSSTGADGFHAENSGGGSAAYGYSSSGNGVRGDTSTGTGVYAYASSSGSALTTYSASGYAGYFIGPIIASSSTYGDVIYGNAQSGSNNGVHGNTTGGIGVRGDATTGYGVQGVTTSSSGVAVGAFAGSGYGIYCQSSNSTCAIFNTSVYSGGTYIGSDIRIKEEVEPLQYGLDAVMSLRPVTFKFKQLPGLNRPETQVGFVADEVETALSGKNYADSVVSRIDKMYEVDNLKTLSDTKIIPLLVRAVQELKTEIDQLRTR